MTGKEENILAAFVNKFDFLKDAIKVVRPRRMNLEVPYGKFREVLRFAVKEGEFPILCTITGLDEGESLGFIYHLAQERGITLNIKTSVPKSAPTLRTITDLFPAAAIYEREVVDLFGAEVEGLPPGYRYPLTDDWPKDQHPLRKDWKGPASERPGTASIE